MKSFVVLVAAALSLSACSLDIGGHKIGGDNSVEQKSLAYEFSYNNCNTGRHEFPSQEAYCNGLKDDALNKYCAISLRYDDFKAKCPGMNWN